MGTRTTDALSPVRGGGVWFCLVVVADPKCRRIRDDRFDGLDFAAIALEDKNSIDDRRGLFEPTIHSFNPEPTATVSG
jgi:hypothetical protein